ncbi:MAG: transcription antitermination factor NusB [Paludibacteraceae bacterium]|nr:transcription antitermination factor NusB [Paludibacteraceae bacterium]
MINRVLIRIKVIQLLYAWQLNRGEKPAMAEKELFESIEKAYELYHWLLQLSLDIKAYATKRIEIGLNKLRPTQEELHPNVRFINNLFVKQLAENEDLKAYNSDKNHPVSWEDHTDFIKDLFEGLTSTELYQDYMKETVRDYEADKMLWRKIYKKYLAGKDELLNQLEDMCLYWNDDIEIVISFVDKTIKRFSQEAGAKQPLLPLYSDPEDDQDFAKRLLGTAIKRQDEFSGWIDETAKNWEGERIATMDRIIMQAALAEMVEFPTIPISVTLNEFVEISKFYSTEKSSNFINGVLDKIASKLREEGKLIKVGAFVKPEEENKQ